TTQKRSKPIVINTTMVGQNTISGFGISPNDINRITIKDNYGTVVYGLSAIQGNQDPVTFTITEGMVGNTIMFTIGNIATEPPEGYANTFMWNKGISALPFEKYRGNDIKIEAIPTLSIIERSTKPVNGIAVED